MMQLLLYALTIAMTLPVFARPGLQSGPTFSRHSVYGEIQVTCRSHSDFASAAFQCFEDILQPREYDYFVGPSIPGAAQVTLVADHDPRNSKSMSYRADIGRSSRMFNLWVRSLLQRPLLQPGENQIQYEITNSEGRVLADGKFKVRVTTGGRLYCPRRGFYQSPNIDDCRSSYNMCNRFFRDNNFCVP